LYFGGASFSSDVFWFEPHAFWGCCFFIGGLWFEPMTKGHDKALLVMALACDFDDSDQCFGEAKLILMLRVYVGSTLLKISQPYELPL
jgi:hypothetical protein